MVPDATSNLLDGEIHRDLTRHEARPPRRVWNINVLLVEDDAADTSLILNVLRRHQGVSSVQASDSPLLTLRQLETNHMLPDLVLLDIRMPRIDGFEFLERLRRIPNMADVPVVFLTTSRLASDVAEAKDSSAASYVIKPESYAELQARLDGVIKKVLSGAWNK